MRLPAGFTVTPRSRGVGLLASAIGAANDGKLPGEFRIFVAGWNETENGNYLFDEEAADATMAAYESWGVDLAIDLEHQMLEAEIPADPTARDARGWCRLELRDDGSLWAVAVTWTPDGAARLSEKRQRYISPAFAFDVDSRRVTGLLNIAITAMPATHSTPALVAASRTRGTMNTKTKLDGKVTLALATAVAALAATMQMTPKVSSAITTSVATLGASGDLSPKLVSSALEAVAAKDAKGALAVLQQILAALLGGSSDDAPVSSAGAGDGGAPAAPADGGGGGDGTAANARRRNDDLISAGTIAMSITGLHEPGAAMAELARRSQIALDVETREEALARDRAALESGERRRLVGELVKLGVEIPATAWQDDKGTVPVERLGREPIADLRERVKKLAAGRPQRGHLTPPAGGGSGAGGESKTVALPNGGFVELSARELAICDQSKCDVVNYAVLKHQRASAQTGGE